jgi:agmatinase
MKGIVMTVTHAPRPTAVTLLGVPLDINSSYMRGPAKAPDLIRAALKCDSANLWTENGLDLGIEGLLLDAGDIDLLEQDADALQKIESAALRVLDSGTPLISLGGDHSVTYPLIRAVSKRYPKLTLVHFDAHPDLYDELLDNRLSHACPFARIMEEGLVARLIQVGIRTVSGHQRAQAKRFGVETITMRKLEQLKTLKIDGPLYISVDMDVMDPAFVPGISHHEPGGMSVRELLTAIQNLGGELISADLVEYNPLRDVDNRSAMVAAKILKELAAKILFQGEDATPQWP